MKGHESRVFKVNCSMWSVKRERSRERRAEWARSPVVTRRIMIQLGECSNIRSCWCLLLLWLTVHSSAPLAAPKGAWITPNNTWLTSRHCGGEWFKDTTFEGAGVEGLAGVCVCVRGGRGPLEGKHQDLNKAAEELPGLWLEWSRHCSSG